MEISFYGVEFALVVSSILGWVGIASMIYGSIRAVYLIVLQHFHKDNYVNEARLVLSQYLALGIEFFIGSDVIDTIVKHDFESLGMLGAVVIIRIILSYSLGRELKDIEEAEEFEHRLEELHPTFRMRNKKKK